jgi:predicted nucleic-acid-binding protein
MTIECWVDTNVLLRFFTQDNKEQTKKAIQLMEKVRLGKVMLHILPLIIAECCYVLTGKVYQLTNLQTANN